MAEKATPDLDEIIDGAVPADGTSDAPVSEAVPQGAAADDGTQEGAEAQPEPLEPPTGWDADAKAQFAAWPREAQQVILDRYKAMEGDYTRKTQEAAELRRSAEPFLQAVAPYQDYLNRIAPEVGQLPHQMIGSLLGVEYQLRTGSPEQKYMALANIAQSYGLDLAALAGGQIPQMDPASLQLRQLVEQQAQQINQLSQTFTQQQEEQLEGFIGQFASSKDEQGQAKYPFFDAVKPAMGQILMQAAEQGQSMSMEEAYSKAVQPIEARIKAQMGNGQAQRQQAVDRAKLASSPRSNGSVPGGSAKAKDLDSLIDENLTRMWL